MRWFVLIALAGCAQLFGLDDTTGSDVASLAITHVSIGNTVITSPQSLAGQTASFLVPDPMGVRVVAATANGNEWSAPVAGTPPILFTLPNFAGLLAIDARSAAFPFALLEHANSAAAAPAATFQVQGTLPSGYVAGEGFALYVVGAWIAHGIPPPALGTTAINTAQFALADTDSLIGPRQKVALADAVLFLRYDATGALTAAGEAPAFDEADANTIIFPSGAVPGAITAVAQDVTLSAPVAPTDIAKRYAATQPAPATPVAMSWSINAAPGSDLGSVSGPTLKSGAVAATDTMVTATFGNPFATKHGWRSTLFWNTSATRTYTPPGHPPATLISELFAVAAAAPGVTLDLTAGLPTMISLDATALTTDGLTATIDPAATVEVSFVADNPANTLYELEVLRLVPNTAGTAMTFEDRLNVFATKPPFQVPGNVFKTGELYTLRVICFQGGFPALSSGDLTMRALPITGGVFDSGVFTAM